MNVNYPNLCQSVSLKPHSLECGQHFEHPKIEHLFKPRLLSVKSSSVLRKEEKGESCDEDFKTIMFKNAPHKDEMSLLLEKGSWN
ncbi:hypothetical protein J4416_03240 [Candidatus Pacearchaeota archaeon]|nr:hypothetical protein [Candidatus Pacearchaeota archaeon]